MSSKIKQEFITELLKAKEAGTTASALKDIIFKYQSQGLSLKKHSDSVALPKPQLKRDLITKVTAQVASILKMNPAVISANAELSSYGMASVYVIELVDQLNNLLGLDLKPSVYFANPTIDSFVNYLLSKHEQELSTRNIEGYKKSNYSQSSMSKGAGQSELRNVAARKQNSTLDIAIVGMDCNLPGSPDLESFWSNLVNKVDMVSEVPADRWSWEALAGDASADNYTACRWGGFIADVDKFDAAFFSISPREAEYMDPQQRLFLQSVWSCIEHSGYRPSSLSGSKTGLYVGVATNDYLELIARSQSKVEPYMGTGLCHSILANRISYFFDFRGPSQAIDTACSSSLVALNRACEDIRNNVCTAAIVGGVNLMLSPSWHIALSRAGMLSPTGRCYSFDEHADGYVRSEGVGTVFLKPLEQAEQDRDTIWGVIKGTAQNHGGRTSSLTAPSPKAQAELLVESFSNARFDPATITYIEAHGTGTRLGDPIEISGLVDAFSMLAKQRNSDSSEVDNNGQQISYCAIGSAKSSIGHLETAAGISSLIKTLLCFKNQTLLGNIHLSKPNSFLDINNTPFYLAQENQRWARLLDNSGQEIPRRAGISSFGFGGVNAHVAIEEYINPEPYEHDNTPQCVMISAKTEASLIAYLAKLRTYLVEQIDEIVRPGISQVAYTLCAGRDQMEYRFACVSDSIADLTQKIKSALAGTSPETYFLNRVDLTKDSGIAFLNELKEQKPILDTLVDSGDYEKIAQLWSLGLNIDSELLYKNNSGQRIPLPSYQFSKDRYWVSGLNDGNEFFTQTKTSLHLHPLIDKNISTLQRQAFLKSYQSFEFYLRDHLVDTKPLLPGVAYIEMARAAGELANPNHTVIGIKNIYWRKPMFIEGSQDCEIELQQNGTDVEFKISTTAKQEGITTLHCTGSYQYGEPFAELPAMDIAALEQDCNQVLTHQECYDAYLKMGISYGASFRTISEIKMNSSQAIASFTLNNSYVEKNKDFTLSPAILDGALQTAIAFIFKGTARPLVPFSLNNIEIYQATPAQGYFHLQLVKTSQESLTVNIDILDINGNCCVRLKQFTARKMKDVLDELCYTPHWEYQPNMARVDNAHENTVIIYTHESQQVASAISNILQAKLCTLIKLGDSTLQIENNHWQVATDINSIRQVMEKISLPTSIYYVGGWLASTIPVSDDVATQRYRDSAVLGLFKLIKAWDLLNWLAATLTIKVITRNAFAIDAKDIVCPFSSALVGMTMSLDKEYPNITAKLINLNFEPSADGADTVAHELYLETLADATREHGTEKVVTIKNHKRFIRKLRETKVPTIEKIALKKHGTYLILGGAGGIGAEFSYSLAKDYSANIAVVGRSKLNADIQTKLDRISSLGGQWMYCSANAENADEMAAAVDAITEKFGPIHGVVHSALVLKDQSLTRMDEKTFGEAFDPKYAGSLNLYNATQYQPLDFFLLLSSAQSFWGNAGQSNYASGCTFKDGLAYYLDQISTFPVRVVNWGYWGDVGVVASDKYRRLMEKAGIGSIGVAEGMETMRRAISGYLPQIIAMKGDANSLREMNVDFTTASKCTPEVGVGSVAAMKDVLTESKSDVVALYASDRMLREHDGFIAMEKTASVAVLKFFQSHNLFTAAGIHYSQNEIRHKLAVISKLERLFQSLFTVLLESKLILRIDQDNFQLQGAHSPELEWQGVDAEYNKLKDVFPELTAHCILSALCINNLGLIISGKKLATDIIFPEGKMTYVEGVYKGAELPDLCNKLIAKSVLQLVESLATKTDRKIKILEVGSGTGGTSAFVLKELAQYQDKIEYVYSDVSYGFLSHGRKKFGDEYPFADFKLFDLEKSPLEQSYNFGEFDIAFGSNVIHATKNIGITLANIKEVMRKDGAILINEVTKFQNFATLTFGMLDGWWLYNDEEKRIHDSPLLSFEQWKDYLFEKGLVNAVVIGDGTDIENNYYEQGIIVAFSDGICHIKKETKNGGQDNDDPIDRGNAKAIEQKIIPKPTVSAVKEIPARSESKSSGRDDIKVATSDKLREIVAEVLKFPVNSINHKSNLAALGIDSIIGIELITKVRQELADISMTAFIECTTIEEVANYLIAHHSLEVASHLNQNRPQVISASAVTSDDREVSSAVSTTLSETQTTRFTASQPETKISDQVTNDPIAIIGLSGQFPGAENVNEFWDNLVNERNSISEVLPARWDWKNYLFETPTGQKMAPRFGGFLQDIDLFDTTFFQISPKEAEKMHPEERLFLQCAWELIEDAGYTRQRLEKLDQRTAAGVGVFVGAMYQHYPLLAESTIEAAALATTSHWAIANRISHFFNLHGPSLAIDTACSSSLMAIHMASESIRRGECVAAIAGGVNLNLHPGKYAGLTRGNMLCSTDRSAALADTDGMLPGEGVGAVLLKPLSKAIEDGDQVWGVLLASASNHSGRTSGFMVPSATAQAKLIVDTIKKANIPVETISYIDLAANGSPIGDAVEIAAIKQAFSELTNEQKFCAIGSVKSNIGHLEASSGISQVAKSLLQFKHHQRVATINLDQLNPNIDLNESAFYLQTSSSEWQSPSANPSLPRRSAISSFGAGGSNVHLILEEPTILTRPSVQQNSSANPELIVLSATTKVALISVAQKIVALLKQATVKPRLEDVAYSLAIGREQFTERLAVAASSVEELQEKLLSFLEDTDGVRPANLNKFQLGNTSMLAIINPLISGEAGESLIQLLFSKREIEKLAWFWVRGVDLDWNQLYEQHQCSFISLPGIVFNKRRCWISQPRNASLTVEQISTNFFEENKNSRNKKTAAPDLDYENFNLIKDEIILIISEVLGVGIHEIRDDQDLTLLGLGSIQAIKLKNAIERHYEIKINLKDFVEQRTAENVATLAYNTFSLIEVTKFNDSDSLMQDDLRLADDIVVPYSLLTINDVSEASTVMLTGGTGFLGAHIISALLQKNSDLKIVCLVRKSDLTTGTKKLTQNMKKYSLWKSEFKSNIRVVEGDLSKPNLGLTDSVWKKLAQDVDIIFHTGAEVNHVKSYKQLRENNVVCLPEIIKLACDKKLKAINFVSSVAVNINVNENHIDFVNEDEVIADPKKLLNGYAQTKWVGEQIIIRAAKQGVPCTILRPAEITASLETGLGQFDDVFHLFIELFFESPITPHWDDAVIDILPVDFVANFIVNASKEASQGCWICNLNNPHPLTFNNLILWYQNQTETQKTYKPFNEWCEITRGVLTSKQDAKSLLLLEWLNSINDFPMLMLYFNAYKPALKNMKAFISQSDLSHPRLDPDALKSVFSHFLISEISMDVL